MSLSKCSRNVSPSTVSTSVCCSVKPAYDSLIFWLAAPATVSLREVASGSVVPFLALSLIHI
eukprot:11182832-Lingulodinium_polyedra.AAC.1